MFCLENGKLMSIKHETVLNDIIHCPVKGGSIYSVLSPMPEPVPTVGIMGRQILMK